MKNTPHGEWNIHGKNDGHVNWGGKEGKWNGKYESNG